VRVPIDPAVWYPDVVSSHPGVQQRRWGCPPIKGNVRWVQTVARQVGLYLSGALAAEGKVPSVREERGAAASSVPVVRQGTAGQPRRGG